MAQRRSLGEETIKVSLRDSFNFKVGEVEIPDPPPPVLIWGDSVFVANGDGYCEISYYIVPDTSESGAHKL